MSLDNQSELNPLERRGQMYTDPEGPVYFLRPGGISPVTGAAAMARLSRSPDDLREIVDKEFSEAGNDEGLIDRVVFQFGDDSVAQLIYVQAVVEGASNLATKHLEWGRNENYLEQSTRYIRYDTKDQNGRYKYLTPAELSPEDIIRFERDIDKIFDLYSLAGQVIGDHLNETMERPEDTPPSAWRQSLKAQGLDAARLLLPVATKSTVGIVGSAQGIDNLVMRLRSEQLQELSKLGEAILVQSRMIIPSFMQRTDLPAGGNVYSAYLETGRELMQARAEALGIHDTLGEDYADSANLISYTPNDELDVIKWVLFETSDASMSEISDAVDKLTDSEKVVILNEYIGERHNRRHKPGRAFERVHYDWEIVCDYGIFRDLQRHRKVDDLRWQDLTPNLGQAGIPALAEGAGVASLYNEAYAISAQLYGHLKDIYGKELAQYATLLGHKMRWVVGYNAREAYHLHELRTAPQGHPGYRALVGKMHKIIAEVHPHITAGMKYVDLSNGPDLTRLEAEKRTAKKLGITD